MLATFQIAISSGAVFGGLLVGSVGPAGVFAFARLSALLGTAFELPYRYSRDLVVIPHDSAARATMQIINPLGFGTSEIYRVQGPP